MNAFVVFAVFFLAGVVSAQDEACYTSVVKACNQRSNKQIHDIASECDSVYGGIDYVKSDLQKFANSHVSRSFDFLLMSTHYGNYEKNRAGFEKLFRDLSDSTWQDAIDLIKYITKRGARMDFGNHKPAPANGKEAVLELYELQSMAKALDIEKELAKDALHIHSAAAHIRKEQHDADVMRYLEKEFAHKHAEKVRELSGHVADLSKLLNGSDSSIALYLFDEYLQK